MVLMLARTNRRETRAAAEEKEQIIRPIDVPSPNSIPINNYTSNKDERPLEEEHGQLDNTNARMDSNDGQGEIYDFQRRKHSFANP